MARKVKRKRHTKRKAVRRSVKRKSPKRKVTRKRSRKRKSVRQTAAHLKSKLRKLADERLKVGLYRRDKAATASQHNAAKRMIANARRDLKHFE